MAFNISQPVDVRSRCANVDLLYGPYNSIEDACSAIPESRRTIGRTVGIVMNNSISEYWWKSGIEDADLVQKIEQLTLSLNLVGDSTFTRNEGEPIFGQFMVDGGAGVKKAVLYQIVGGNESFVQEYGNIGKKSTYTFEIPNPPMSGTYQYRIKVLDSLDNYAVTAEDTNYIEYVLYYGGMSAIYNLTELNSIKIKNYNTVANIPFDINISVRDSSFSIQSVCLTDMTDENPSGISINLPPSTGEYIGNNTYYMPNSSTLAEQLNGKRCSVVINYTESGTARQNVRNLFKLLDIATIDLIPEYEGQDYYATLPGYYVFTIEAAVENLSIVLTPGDGSDFNFERSTVAAYRRFSLKVVPDDIEKTAAQIVINYTYTYDNRDYTGSFTRVIGNILPLPEQSYYEPGSSTYIVRRDLVYADAEHNTGVDNGQYYQLVSDPISEEFQSSSFILDTHCKINQQNNNEINYIEISYGGVNVAKITEDEISCAVRWGGLYTDTPINEWAQIGIGINLQETFRRGEEEPTAYYHAIYVNGMVVKTVKIDNSSVFPLTYSGDNRLVVSISNGILVQKCFLYYKNNGTNIIYPNTDIGESIIYNNYKSHKPNFREPDQLPELMFLRISDDSEGEVSKYYRLINEYKSANDQDAVKYLTIFGNIGDTKAQSMNLYDPNYSSNATWEELLANHSFEHDNAELFRQHVEIKKPAQKEYAVLCRAKWGDNPEMEDVIVEVHTQGTSTLVYSVPNFKFTFWHLTQNQGVDVVEPFYPEFIPKPDGQTYYEECVYTAKADFMDSSHINNTPTCNYYNNLIQDLISSEAVIEGERFIGSPSARNGMLDAIFGIPIIMQISDVASSFDDNVFMNVGSFMLNIDKTGASLGFEVDDSSTGTHMSCISFEGSSNDDGTGAAARFDNPNHVELKDYMDHNTGQVDTQEIDSDYAFVQTNIITPRKGLNDYVEYGGEQMLVRDVPYVKWCLFLSDGLEYRYPDSDMYKEKNGALSKVMKKGDFAALFEMWWWVYNSDTLSQSDYQREFVQHFNLAYCIIYFINLMTYAQTDNLGKNAMFDYWSGDGKWYPRPYDLDSETGLDNNGNDNIAPFVEICAPFSLNYDINKQYDYAWRAENYLIDKQVTDPQTGITYPKSTIEYSGQTYDRYHFSSSSSKLWINFYKNYKDSIERVYANLRNNYNYSSQSIISFCEDILIDVLGINQYNQDFRNKYLQTDYQNLGYGNRWYKFKKWATKRFAFCDSYFGATEIATYNLVSNINYNIKVDAPQYIAQQYQGESNRETKFVTEQTSFSAGSGAATKITLLVNQPSVFDTSLFKYVTYDGGSKNYTNLISLDVSGNLNSGFTSFTSVTGESLNNLKYLNISNSSVQNLNVPINVENLIAESVNLTTINIPRGCAVREISFRGTRFFGQVIFSGLNNLTTLDLTDCIFDGSVTFEDLPVLDELIMNNSLFNGGITISTGVNIRSFDFTGLGIQSITFSGSNLGIDTINFHNTRFGNTTLNLNAISQDVRDLYFDGCEGLEHIELSDDYSFGENLNCFSFAGSSIKSIGNDTRYFDCSKFTNISSIKKVSNFLTTGVTYTGFNFYNTKIESIINLDWTGNGESLFRDCQRLVSISGSIWPTTSVAYMFYRCKLLEALPSLRGEWDTVSSAAYVFANANLVSFAWVWTFISKCKYAINFTGALQCKQFDNNQIVNIYQMFNQYSGSDGLILDSFLSCDTASYFSSVTNNIQVVGKLPVETVSAKSMFARVTTLSIPYDFICDAINLVDAENMFALTNTTFSAPQSPAIDNRPKQIDSHSEIVTLSNAVDNNFFPKSNDPSNQPKLENVSRMFVRSNIITNDADLFRYLPALKYSSATFASASTRAFTFTNSASETEIIPLNTSTVWKYNPLIENIAGCFANDYSVYCDGLEFHQSLDSSKIVDVSGLFGIESASYRSSYPIYIDIDSIGPSLKMDYVYRIYNQYAYHGTFQNRSVYITTVPSGNEIFSKLNDVSRYVFNGAMLYIPTVVTEFNLSNIITSCEGMFQNCRIYKNLGSSHSYTVNDRKFVTVNLPVSCAIYSKMFNKSSVLADLPTINSSGASDLNHMFSGCVINQSALELPCDYFRTCAGSLSDTSYMFLDNMYLTTLEYNANKDGLFEGCINLSNVTGMFENAMFLHKGIPVNLFGTTELPKLTSLSHMFALTSIIYDVEDNSHKWFDATTIQPLTNLNNIEYMFYRNKIYDATQYPDYNTVVNQEVVDEYSVKHAPISPESFASRSLLNITKLFENTVINPPSSLGRFRFTEFTIGKDAFLSCSVDNIQPNNFVENISKIANADRMFYQSVTGGRRGRNIDNLKQFVDQLDSYQSISKKNVAGGIDDNTIPAIYTETIPDESDLIYYGRTLQQDQSPEALNKQYYGRYIYNS